MIICPKKKKLQVFVSSTYSDLKEERQAAVEAILQAGHIPAGMELFAAGDESQMDVIKRWIDDSEVFLLILGGRYGSIEPKSQKSYVHLEYEYAIEKGKTLFSVVIDEKYLEKKVKKIGSTMIEMDHPDKLREFRAKVLSRIVKIWRDPRDIKVAILETMTNFSNRVDLTGWIRGKEAAGLEVAAEEIARLSSVNQTLKEKLSNVNRSPINSMSGKSFALPNLPLLEWIQTIRDPIWGEIPITHVEKSVIQTGSFYRLRGIKQLSFAHLAFPGAVHSRFEHSIGVMHATDMLLKMVKSEGGDKGIMVSPLIRQLLRLAALLHDIGHPPFSHMMENLFTYHPDILRVIQSDLPHDFNSYLTQHGIKVSDIYKHEVFSQYIIRQHLDIKNILRNWVEINSDYPKAYTENYLNTITDIISQLAIGKSLDINPDEVPENLLPIMQLFKSIMSGDIDADKIDYLLRDNYYCGLTNRLDITSLRNHLILRSGGLEIEPEAISFVHSLILARYTLITQVHQEMWGVFTTAKVIELLHKMLLEEPNPAQKILDIFTTWDDSRLLDYLISSGDSTIKAILTTRYPLKEIARLENIETHPHVRECIQILSESIHQYQIPKLQEDLRIASGNNNLFVHLHNVKSPEFSMKLSNGGDLLRDQILRGISEESLSNLSLAIYGVGNVEIDFQKLKTARPELLPCEDCPIFDECVGNLAKEGLKRLLAELAVRRYRKIVEDCGAKAILDADYLLLIMEKINSLCKKNELDYPIRQAIYKIAKLLARNLQDKIEIKGKMILKKAEITSTFDQELRKYEQMGLIANSREIRKLPSESVPLKNVFRFDRRFRLSDYGKERLDKVRRFKGTVPEYEEYHKAWEIVEMEIQKHEDEIVGILKDTSR